MSMIYRSMISAADKFVPKAMRPLWEHPAGPKTVFFWAPVVKWGLVIASISDIQRPAEKLSPSQIGALAATGVIWSRYSLVITPKNWGLFSVNAFVAVSNLYQLFRIYNYRRSLKQELKVQN